MKSCYIAGPWVFRKDAKEHGEYLRSIVEKCGLKALLPIDNESNDPLEIKRSNLRLIRNCNYVVADITPFRGISCDVGTAFEIGFAAALGKPVYLWSSCNVEYKYKARNLDGMNLEDFSYVDNLMLCAGKHVYKSFEEALDFLVYWENE